MVFKNEEHVSVFEVSGETGPASWLQRKTGLY